MLLPTSAPRLPPRDVVAGLEARPRLGTGPGEHCTGYGVLGVTFESGDLLALRRFAATSVGPAYTSVWRRSPAGRWTMYQDLQEDAGCGRYFSSAVDIVTARIRVVWSGADCFSIVVEARTPLAWQVWLASTSMTRAITRLASTRPWRAATSPPLVRACSIAAGRLLGSGPLSLRGRTPNGFVFDLRPGALWVVRHSSASVNGRSLGSSVPTNTRASLGSFDIPRRGLFATMEVVLRRQGG